MKFSRRLFLSGASLCAIATLLIPHPIEAWIHGWAGPSGTSVVGGFGVNAFPYMNFAKQSGSIAAGTTAWPGNLSSDGYPLSAPSTAIAGNMAFPAEYFGRNRIKFSGQGGYVLTLPTIVYNGGVFITGVTPSNTGSVASNFTMSGQTNPGVSTAIEFSFGALIGVVADNGSGLVRLTSSVSSAFNNFGVSGTTQINNVSNLTGQWAFTRIDANNIDLVGSVFSASMIPASGGPGTQAEAILSVAQVNWNFPTSGAYSSMSNLIFCCKADVDGTNPFGLQNGYQVNADLVAQIRQLNPKYLRLMDSSSVIQSTESNYIYRPKTTNYSTAANNARWYPDYWVGALTNGGSDVYTCSNPVASGGGAYVDGEVVQAQVSGANTTVNPVINVNSRGNAPIYTNSVVLQNLTLSGSPTTGDVISITFTGSYIPTGSYVFNYTTKSSDTSLNTLGASITTAINADVILNALTNAVISATNAGAGKLGILYNTNAGSGTTFSASVSGAATEIVTLGRFAVGTIANNQLLSLTYNAVLGGFIMSTAQAGNASGGGLSGGMPDETMCELCNRARVGLWINLPLLYTNTSVTARIVNIASLLSVGLPLTVELSNEVWNFAQVQTTQAQALGLALGFPVASLRSIHGLYALRVRQFMEQAANAWTGAGRNRLQLNCNALWQEFTSTSGVNTWRLQGQDLATINTFYAAKGGPGGSAGTDYTSVGNRSFDVCDSGGWATYWYGACFGQGASTWTGSITNFDAALQASSDYASGNPTLMASALLGVYNDVNDGTLDTGNDRSALISAHLTTATSWDMIVAAFDAGRAGFGKAPANIVLYEGANQVSFSASVQGFTTSPAALAAQFATNGWNTAPYGASNTVVAQNIINLWFAFLNSPQAINAVNSLYNGLLAAGTGRKVSPSQFQYDGAALWALFPGDLYTTPFQTYNAISAFNSVIH